MKTYVKVLYLIEKIVNFTGDSPVWYHIKRHKNTLRLVIFKNRPCHQVQESDRPPKWEIQNWKYVGLKGNIKEQTLFPWAMIPGQYPVPGKLTGWVRSRQYPDRRIRRIDSFQC